MLKVCAIFANGLWDFDVVFNAEFPVIGTMPGSDMDDARSLFGGREIGRKSGNVVVIALTIQRVLADRAFKLSPFDFGFYVMAGDAGFSGYCGNPGLRNEHFFTNNGQTVFSRGGDFKNHIIDIRAIGDGTVAGHGPGRRRPDDDGGAFDFRG